MVAESHEIFQKLVARFVWELEGGFGFSGEASLLCEELDWSEDFHGDGESLTGVFGLVGVDQALEVFLKMGEHMAMLESLKRG